MEITQEQMDEAIKAAVEKATADLAESVKKLEAKNAEILAEKKAAAAKAREAEAKAAAEAEAAAKKSGNVEALEASWQAKYDTLKQERDASDAEKTGVITDLTAGATATSIAAEMALKGSESVLAQLIRPQIGVEIQDGKSMVRILDKTGKPTAATVDDFKKELAGNAALKPLLAGSQGSGGGAPNQTGGAGGSPKEIKREAWTAMSPRERSEFAKTGGKLVD